MDVALRTVRDLSAFLAGLPDDRYYAFLVFMALMGCLALVGFTVHALTRKR